MLRGKEVRIELIHEYAPDARGTKFLVAAKRRLEECGVELVAGNLPRAIEGAQPQCICDALNDCFEGLRQSVAGDRSGSATARPRKGGRRSRRRFRREPCQAGRRHCCTIGVMIAGAAGVACSCDREVLWNPSYPAALTSRREARF